MIKINGVEIEGNCVSINNGNIIISNGESIKISSFKEKEIHIHGDVHGDVDCTNLTVGGDVKGDVDGTNINIKGSVEGSIDGTNIRIGKR